MTLDQIKYFTAAATYQHVGRAAMAIAISPSVISATIGSLEEELKCELFRKSGRRIELTPEGTRLLERFKSILTEIEGIKTEMRGEPETFTGRLRIGASHFLASRLLLSGWSQLSKDHPHLVADIYSLNTSLALADVVSGRVDLALVFSPFNHPDLKEFRIIEGEMVVVVKKGHPILKKSAREQLQFLSKAKAVIHKSTQGVESCESHPIFEALGFQPKIEIYFDSDDTAVQRVLDSESWTFVPDIVARAYKSQLQIITIPKHYGTAPYHISTLVHRERNNENALLALVGSLKMYGKSEK